EGVLDHGLALAGTVADEAGAALPLLECARARAPDRVEPVAGLARLALALGRTDEAVDHALALERLRPELPAGPFLRATALYRAYRFEGARTAAERVVTLLPRDPLALALLARVRGVTRDPGGA